MREMHRRVAAGWSGFWQWRRSAEVGELAAARTGLFAAHRVLRAVLAAEVVLSIALAPLAGGVLAAFEVVELPAEIRKHQASILYYADGVSELARVGIENRTAVPLSEVPLHVRRAVLTAEDRGFYSHDALSWRGVGRALVSNAISGDTQGASTITQQFVKNAYLGPERTFDRKAREAVLATKAEQRFSKDEILGLYLNIIYFGRGAYGIDAAAKTFFGVPSRDLTVEQGAVLAANIKSPTGYDPVKNRQASEDRWRYLLKNMVAAGWLSAPAEAAARYPEVVPAKNVFAGATGYVIAQVELELRAHGITEQQLRTAGLRVVTTIDKGTQQAAVAAMGGALAGQDRSTRGALAAITPRTGAVRAYLGGTEGYGYFDYGQGSYPAGSTILPYLLAGGLEAIAARVDSQELAFLAQRSARTGWRPWSGRTRPDRAMEWARKAGLGRSEAADRALAEMTKAFRPGVTNLEHALGRYPVSPLGHAAAHATIAADGTYAPPHFVKRASKGREGLVRARSSGAPVLDDAVAGALSLKLGGSDPVGPHGRPDGAVIASDDIRYGTRGASSDAWTVGFTPDLSVAVWLGHDKPAALTDTAGNHTDGRAVTSAVWTAVTGRGSPREEPY